MNLEFMIILWLLNHILCQLIIYSCLYYKTIQCYKIYIVK